MIHVILKQQKRSGYTDWTLRWQDHTKGIGRVGNLSKRDAQRIRREFEANVNNGEVATPARRSGVGTLADFRAWHEQQITHVKHGTQGAYRTAFGHLLSGLGDDMQLSSLDSAAVSRLRRHLLDKGLMANTQNTVIGNLAGAWNRAAAHNLVVGKNPLAGQSIKVRKGTGTRRRVILTDEQRDAMVEGAAYRLLWQTLLVVLFDSGLRIGEALNLRWIDIDLDADVLHVAGRAAGQVTIDGRTYRTPGWDPKSEDSNERTLPLPSHVVKQLRVWRGAVDRSPYVFIDERRLGVISGRLEDGRFKDNEHLLQSRVIYGALQRIYAKARVVLAVRRDVAETEVEDFRPQGFHDLRHGYLTRMARVVPVQVLRELAGHSDVKTTLSYYVHVDKTDLDRARQALERPVAVPETEAESTPKRPVQEAEKGSNRDQFSDSARKTALTSQDRGF